jgi:hypothetical protein
LILDAKSLLFKKFDYTTASLNGAPFFEPVPCHGHFQSSKDIVQKIYNISLPEVCAVGIPSWFHTETLKSLIIDTEELTGEKFHTFFLRWAGHPTRLTEFYLYSGYVLKKYGSYEKLYATIPLYSSVNLSIYELEQFDTRLDEMKRPSTFVGMLHRQSYRELEDGQKNNWLEFLLSKQLIANLEETKQALDKTVGLPD